MQRVWTIYDNSGEIFMFILASLICLTFNSVLAGVFVLISSGLLISHSVDLKSRNKYSQWVLIAQFIFIVLFILFKVFTVKVVEETADKRLFLTQYRYLTSLGFSVEVRPEEALLKDSDYTGVCTTQIITSESYGLEATCALLVAFSSWRLARKSNRAYNLQHTPRKNFLRLLELEQPQ